MRKFAAVLVLVLLAAVPAPKSAEAAAWWLIIPLVENFMNRKATEPIDRSTSECKVSANASWDGKTYGTQTDLNKWVIGVRRGAVVHLDAVLVGKPHLMKMVGGKVHCNDPDFRPVMAEALPKPDKRGNRRLCADTNYVTDSGCIFNVPTAGLGFKGYTLQVDLFFTNGQRQVGLFGTGRHPYSDSTKTLVQLVVMDDAQIEARVNDPEVQKALQYSFGLQPAIPQLGPANIPIHEEVLSGQLNSAPQATVPVPAPVQSAPPPQYQSPTPQSIRLIPPTVKRMGEMAGRPSDRPWYEATSWEAPPGWRRGCCFIVLFFVKSDYTIIESTPPGQDRREVEVWVNGVQVDKVYYLESTSVFSDETSTRGVVYDRFEPNSDIRIRFRGKNYAFKAAGEHQVLWQPLPAP